MRPLIIFTRRFPYAKTEAFLESEVKVLSEYFDEIKIFPAYDDEYVRELPSNVSIDKTFTINAQKRKLTTLKSIVSGKLIKYLIDHRNKISNLSDILNLVRHSSYEIYYKDVFEKNNIDFNGAIVYSYWFSYIVNSLVEIKLNSEQNYKLITKAHRWDIYEEGSPVFPYRQNVINNLDSIYSISLDGKKYLTKRYNNSNKIKVSRLGVIDRGVLSNKSEQNKFVVLSVSQVTERKRVLFLYESLCNFANKNKDIEINWVHFGVGNQSEALLQKTKNTTVDNLRVDLKGYVKNELIYEFYKNSCVDVFVNLSSSEGVPVSIMEAQSFGVPVIATNVGGSGEIVNDHVGVLLSPNPNINEVYEALNKVYTFNYNRQELKNAWSKISNAEHNFEEFSKELLTL